MFKQVFELVTIVYIFLKSCVDIFGPDLLCRLRHGGIDDRTFDFFAGSPPEPRQLVLNEPTAIWITETPWFMDTESPIPLISVQQILENPWFFQYGVTLIGDKKNLERVEGKNYIQLRISCSRSFDWRYFQRHRSTPSLSNLPVLSGNFWNFRNSRRVRP